MTEIKSETVEVCEAGEVASHLWVAVLPDGWSPDDPVTVVAGLPEGCKVEPYIPGVAADVDGEVVAVVIRTVRTERVPDIEAFHQRRKVRRDYGVGVIDRLIRHVNVDGDVCGACVQDGTGNWLADIDDDGMVEVLVEDDQ